MIELIWWSVITLLSIVSVIALCFPAFLVRLLQVSSRQNNGLSSDRLNKPMFIDRIIYRNHQLFGVLIWLLSSVALYLLIFKLNLSSLIQQSERNPFGMQGWLFESVITLALVTSVIGCCVGIVLLMRPSVLKSLEAWGNRWISVPEKWVDQDVAGQALENWVIQHTRLFGLLVFLSAAIIWGLIFGLD